MTKSEIKLVIELDENKIPSNIKWQATDLENEILETSSFFLSVWDNKKKETLKIDLWTKDMRLDDMKLHFYQTLYTMADTLKRATGETELVEDLKHFTSFFGEQIGIVEKE